MEDGESGVGSGRRKESCEYCHSSGNLMRCSRCRGVYYCNREHQLQDWKKHRRWCKKIVAAARQDGGAADPSSAGPRGVGCQGGRLESSEIKSSLPAEKQHREASQSDPSRTVGGEGNPGASDNNTSISNETKVDEVQNSVQPKTKSRPDPSLFDPRPYVHTDFPKPESRDADVVAKHAAAELKRNGYCVLDGFLAEECGRSVLEEVKRIRDSGVMVDGPLSGGRTSSEKAQKFTEKAIRGDKIMWLQGNEMCYPSVRTVIAQMDELIQRLNFYLQGLYTISGRTKAMVACYPGNGAGYARHIDNPNQDGRCVTCLYYLNDNWDVKTQGGLLRLLPASGGHVDIQPLLNRLLLFWSDRRNPHEVQPAYSMRYAITVWYFDKTERGEAKMAQLNEDMSRLCGEVALSDTLAQTEQRDQKERQIQKTSQHAVASLSQQELQALAAMLDGQPDPRAILSNLGVASSIQDALLSQLTEMGPSGC